MTTLREAIEQTVAILGPEAPLCSGCVEEWTEALRILRAALAEQPAEQEPVAWRGYTITNGYTLHFHYREAHRVSSKIEPLYTAPQPAKREPLPPASPCALTEAEYRIFKLGWLECEAAHGIGEQE